MPYQSVTLRCSTGFIKSLEFLKKYENLQTSFPGLEKIWRIDIKSGQNGKKTGIFSIL